MSRPRIWAASPSSTGKYEGDEFECPAHSPWHPRGVDRGTRTSGGGWKHFFKNKKKKSQNGQKTRPNWYFELKNIYIRRCWFLNSREAIIRSAQRKCKNLVKIANNLRSQFFKLFQCFQLIQLLSRAKSFQQFHYAHLYRCRRIKARDEAAADGLSLCGRARPQTKITFFFLQIFTFFGKT